VSGSVSVFDIDFEKKTASKKICCKNAKYFNTSEIVYLNWTPIKIGEEIKLVI